jgi:murein DD-endopeptidase MepM/ murein hydrolase activator NlpD
MKKRPGSGAARPIAAMIACFYCGGIAGWWLRATVGPVRPPEAVVESSGRAMVPPVRPAATSGPPSVAAMPPGAVAAMPPGAETRVAATAHGEEPGSAIEVLRQRHLRLPVDGVNVESLKSDFVERRSGKGGHPHEAVDILAPRNTPVHAVEDGTIAKLFESKAGGHTIYQADPTGRFIYYYAHLEQYADGLHEGQRVAAGDVIGYVGTSGNAPPGTPHLHFAISELGPDRRWWQGQAIDPYPVFNK